MREVESVCCANLCGCPRRNHRSSQVLASWLLTNALTGVTGPRRNFRDGPLCSQWRFHRGVLLDEDWQIKHSSPRLLWIPGWNHYVETYLKESSPTRARTWKRSDLLTRDWTLVAWRHLICNRFCLFSKTKLQILGPRWYKMNYVRLRKIML